MAYDESREAWRSVRDGGWHPKEFGIFVWRSTRVGGEKSRRTLKLPERCVVALRSVYRHQIRPVRESGATAMDQIFKRNDQEP